MKGAPARARLAVLGAVAAAAVAAATVPTTTGAFTGRLPAQAASVATNSAWTCADAVAQEGASALLSYRFDDASGASRAADSTGSGRDGTYVRDGNKSNSRGICYRDQGGFPYVLKGVGTSVGTARYVETPVVPLGSAFTLEIWFSTSVSLVARANRAPMGFLMSSGTPSSDPAAPDASAMGLYLTSGGRLVLAARGGAVSIATPAGTNYADDYWYHVAATYSATDGLSLYVNGHLVGSVATTLPALSTGWRIGYGSPAGWPQAPSLGAFSGSLRFAAMYSTGLSATAVAQHAAAGSGTRTSDNTAPDYRG